jgi:hypothetical protein
MKRSKSASLACSDLVRSVLNDIGMLSAIMEFAGPMYISVPSKAWRSAMRHRTSSVKTYCDDMASIEYCVGFDPPMMRLADAVIERYHTRRCETSSTLLRFYDLYEYRAGSRKSAETVLDMIRAGIVEEVRRRKSSRSKIRSVSDPRG